MFDASLDAFAQLQRQLGPVLDTGLLLFARALTFIVTGPIFNRRNLPFMLKVIFAIFLTVSLVWLVPVPKAAAISTAGGDFYLLILVNMTIGAMMGFSANLLLLTINAAGNVLNNQIGLSSAMLLDPSTGTQTMVMEPLFNMIGTILFIQLGGLHWMINALERSCRMFPLYQVQHKVLEVFDMDYLVQLSGDTVTVAVQLVAPVMVVTIAVDIILGIVNRSAQQMPVFQLSFALKPAIGVAVLLMTLPILINSMIYFLNDHARLF
ncbi:MAG: flagellar biosynthetic protein FliR [Vampirovibrionales bacterium]|nr:flagellar biosynthetic protein FliR [Vampirovibrionales bacterium]